MNTGKLGNGLPKRGVQVRKGFAFRFRRHGENYTRKKLFYLEFTAQMKPPFVQRGSSVSIFIYIDVVLDVGSSCRSDFSVKQKPVALRGRGCKIAVANRSHARVSKEADFLVGQGLTKCVAVDVHHPVLAVDQDVAVHIIEDLGIDASVVAQAHRPPPRLRADRRRR